MSPAWSVESHHQIEHFGFCLLKTDITNENQGQLYSHILGSC